MKKGLVLEGGAMRGIFTAGVVDVLLEENIYFDGVIGVSAGACFGINYVSNQPGRTIRYNKRFAKDPRYCSIRSLIKTGDMFGVDFCYNRIPNELDVFDSETFANSKTEFYVVATDIVAGKPAYKKLETGKGEDLEWIRASATVPLVSRVVDIGDGHYMDGGISDSIPLEYFQKNGYEKCVTVLTKPRDYRKNDSHQSGLARIIHHKYPALAKVLKDRPAMYNAQLEYIKQQEEAGNIIVIAPPYPLPIGRVEHDPEIMQKAYDMGRAAAQEKLHLIKEFLLSDAGDGVICRQ